MKSRLQVLALTTTSIICRQRMNKEASGNLSQSGNPVSTEQIHAVAKFLPIFENIDPDNFAHLDNPVETTDGVPVLGHLEYHPAVYEFMDVCYENGLVQGFDWVAWTKVGRRYMKDPARVASARLTTCTKLITAHLRAERFCDGHLEEMLRSGHITAILRRLQKFV